MSKGLKVKQHQPLTSKLTLVPCNRSGNDNLLASNNDNGLAEECLFGNGGSEPTGNVVLSVNNDGLLLFVIATFKM